MELFQRLIQAYPNGVSHDNLILALRDGGEPDCPSAYRGHVCRLRKLLRPLDINIIAQPKWGYCLEVTAVAASQAKAACAGRSV